jgi:YihY family inner membrane protein
MARLAAWWRARVGSLGRRRGELRTLEREYESRLAKETKHEVSALERRVARRAPRLARTVVGPAAEIAERLGPDDVSTHAGAMTYGAFLSIPPLLLFGSAIAGFVFAGHPEAEARALGQLISLMPGLGPVVSDSMKTAIDGRVSVGLLGLAALLWAASGFASRIRHALGEVFRTERTGLIGGRFVGMVVGMLIVGAIVALAVLSALGTWAARVRPAGILLPVVGFVVVAAGEFGFFLAVYRTLTPKGPRWAVHVPGAILFILGWEGLKALAGLFFAQVVARSTALYGTLGSIFAFIGFLYGTMWLLLLGAETSLVLARRRRREPRAI